jgi:hypothetical protein
MTSHRGNEGVGSVPPDGELSWVQRLMLYFTTPLRKTAAVVVVVGVWLALNFWTEAAGDSLFFGLLPGFFFYPSIFVLAVLFTQGGFLRRPVRLPTDVMWRTAAGRFTLKESWASARNVTEVLDTLQTVFSRPGAAARQLDCSLWVELGKDWDTAGFRHHEAAVHMKFPVFVHFFATHADGGTTVTAFSGDSRLAGMWDVLKLSDEMAEAAVRAARDATSDESG